MFGRETFIVRVAEDAMAPRVRAGDYVWIDPDESAADGHIVAVRADGAGRQRDAGVRLMAVESARSVPRAANPGRPDMAAIRANETMIRRVAVFVARAV